MLDAFHVTFGDEPTVAASLLAVKTGKRPIVVHGNALDPTRPQAGA